MKEVKLKFKLYYTIKKIKEIHVGLFDFFFFFQLHCLKSKLFVHIS